MKPVIKKIFAVLLALMLVFDCFPLDLVKTAARAAEVNSNAMSPSFYSLEEEGSDTLSTNVVKEWINTKPEDRCDVVLTFGLSWGIVGGGSTSTRQESVTVPKGETGVIISYEAYDMKGQPFHSIELLEETGGNNYKYLGSTVAADGTITVYNTATKDISVGKQWMDDNIEGHTSVTVRLMQYIGNTLVGQYGPDLVITGTGINWNKGVFYDVPMGGLDGNSNPVLYNYKVVEVKIDESTTELESYDWTVVTNSDGSFTLINDKKVPDGQIALRIEKTWDSIKSGDIVYSTFLVTCVNDPSFTPIEVTLTGSALSPTAVWSMGAIPSLVPGTTISRHFIVTETDSSGNFVAQTPVVIEADGRIIWQFTNSEAKVSLEGEKTWVGGAPTTYAIDVYLLRDGERITSEDTGDRVVHVKLEQDDPLEYSFGNNWPRFDPVDGHEYIYTVEEVNVPNGYYSVVDGMNVTNYKTDIGEDRIVVLQKIWNPDGYAYESFPLVQLELYEDGVLIRTIEVEGGTRLVHVFTLDDITFKENSTYTVKETYKDGTINWNVLYSQMSGEFGLINWTGGVGTLTVTNTLTKDQEPSEDPTYTELYIRKIWSMSDGDPDDMTATFDLKTLGASVYPVAGEIKWLSGDGEIVYDPSTGKAVITIDGNGYIVIQVPTHDAKGMRLRYAVDERTNDGFITTYNQWQNAYVYTNTQQAISFSASKLWKGLDISAFGNNIGELNLILQRSTDGSSWEDVITKKLTIANFSVTSEGLATRTDATFGSFAIYDPDGNEYIYRVYETSTRSDWAYFDQSGNLVHTNGKFELVNTYDPMKETTTVSVQKTWTGDAVALYPDVLIQLKADGENAKDANGVEIPPYLIEGTDAKTYNFSFFNLPKYREEDGNRVAIVYTVVEIEIYSQPLVGGKVEIWDGAAPDRQLLCSYILESITTPSDGITYHKVTNRVEIPPAQKRFDLVAYKVWGPEPYGHREDYPDSVTFGLTGTAGAGSQVIERTAKLSENGDDGEWMCIFTDLPQFDEDGMKYSYDLYEILPPDNFDASVLEIFHWTTATRAEATIINEPSDAKTVEITVKKAWAGDDVLSDEQKALLRTMGDIKVIISSDDSAGHDYVFLNEENEWTATFEWKIPITKNGSDVPIVYTLTEETPTGFAYSYSGIGLSDGLALVSSEDGTFTIEDKEIDGTRTITITNTLDTTVSLAGKKTWDDAGFEDYRPLTLSATLQRRPKGTTDEDLYVDAGEAYVVGGTTTAIKNEYIWTWESGNVDKYVSEADAQAHYDGEYRGVEWEYRWVETSVPNGYELKVPADGIAAADGVASLVNTYVPIGVTVTKTWVIPAAVTGLQTAFVARPTSIEVKLYRNVLNTESGEYEADTTFTTLTGIIDIAADETQHYTFTGLPKYDTNGELYEYYAVETPIVGYSTDEDGLEITNAMETVSINGQKKWEGDTEVIRPEITLNLVGKNEAGETVVTRSLPVTSANSWAFAFNNLPKYDYSTGAALEIIYELTEEGADGYDLTVTGGTYTSGTISVTPGTIVQLTNTLRTKDIDVEKVWEDDNQTELRPLEIVFELHRNAGGIIEETEATFVQEIILNEDIGWKKTITGLTEKNSAGVDYTYWVKELQTDSLLGYYSERTSPLTITNTLRTVELDVTKYWTDYVDVDDIPYSVSVILTGRAGSYIKVYDAVTLNAAGSWKHTFKDLPCYAYNSVTGNYDLIIYSLDEEKTEGFHKVGQEEIEISEGMTRYTASITNAVTYTEILMKKLWVGADPSDVTTDYQGLPESITVNLLRDGEKVDSKTIKRSEYVIYSGQFHQYVFTNLPAADRYGNKYTYTLSEEKVDGFTTDVQIPGVQWWNPVITNTCELTEIKGQKVWMGDIGKLTRPTIITLTLTGTADGKTVYQKTETISGIPSTSTGAMSFSFTGLPKYHYTDADEAAGTDAKAELIVYTLTESGAPGYTLTVTGATIADGVITVPQGTTNLILTNTLKTIELKGKKTWDDIGNTDTNIIIDAYLHPDEILISLYRKSKAPQAQAELVTSPPISVTGPDWEWDFTDDGYPEKDGNGYDYDYWVEEEPVPLGYTVSEGQSMNLTNTLKTVELEVTKNWLGDLDGNNNPLASRPGGVPITLTGKVGNTVVYTETATILSATWKHKFENLPRYAYVDNIYQLVTYTVVETVPNGYKDNPAIIQPGTPSATENYTASITNELDPISVTVTKAWLGDTYIRSEGIETRPAVVTMVLTRKVANTPDTVFEKTLTIARDADPQSVTFENLASHNDAGLAYTYMVDEQEVKGYDKEIEGDQTDGFVITNTLVPTEVSVKKKWFGDDASGIGTRPAQITLILTSGNGQTPPILIEKTIDTAADMEQDWVFENLPKYVPFTNTLYTYTVTEKTVNGYEVAVTGDQTVGFVITNTLEVVDLTLVKNWISDTSASRPSEIVITIVGIGTKGGEANQEYYRQVVTIPKPANDRTNSWTKTITGLPKYDETGALITYTVTETPVPSYALPTYVQPEADADEDEYFATINNSRGMVSLSGEKTWDDQDNAFGTRPLVISVYLYQVTNPAATKPEQPFATRVVFINPLTQKWEWSFDNLPGFVEGSTTPYIYYVEEAEIIGYTPTVTGGSITNTLDTTSLSGIKEWAIGDDDSYIPDSITLNLMRYNPETLQTEAFIKNSVPVTLEVTKEMGWNWSFTGLPAMYKGKTAVYSVVETPVNGFKTTIVGTTVTNTLDMIEIEVDKKWLGEGLYGITQRPAKVEITLTSSDSMFAPRTLDLTAGDWKGTFENLPRYVKGQATLAVYTVTETKVPNYTATIESVEIPLTATGSTFTATVSNTLDLTELAFEKVWDDDNNAFGQRPASITVNLYRNGATQPLESKIVTETDDWKGSFTGLLAYDTNGDAFTYTIDENTVAGYKPAVIATVGGVETITNTLDVIDITVTKDWQGEGTYTGANSQRPAEVVVTLSSSDTAFEPITQSLTAASWQYTFENLPRYVKGTTTLAVYTVTETKVANYTVAKASFEVVVTKDADSYEDTIINTLDLIDLAFQKKWEDDKDALGQRPESITVNLYRNTVLLDSRTVGEQEGWAGSFTGLLLTDKNGIAYTYTMDEDEVADYTVNIGEIIDGSVLITNSLGTASFEGTKAWELYGNDDYFPASITLALMRYNPDTHETEAVFKNGVPVTLEVTDVTDWNWSFDDLPAMYKGEPAEYSVVETPVNGFITDINGTEITNTLDVIEIAVTKEWLNDSAYTGSNSQHPAKVEITLTSSDSTFAQRTLDLTADDWKGTFENLPRYVKGTTTLAVYTVAETEVPNYTAAVGTVTVEINATKNSYEATVSNTLELIDLAFQKEWEDDEDAFGQRPEEITVNLYRNTVLLDSRTVGKQEGWAGSFEGLLTVDKNGDAYAYTMDEDEAQDYEVEINIEDDGWVITNSLETISLSGTKTWELQGNEGYIPDSITLNLMRYNPTTGENEFVLKNGTPVTLEVTDAANWDWTFDDLPAMYKGETAEYSVVETPVNGFITDVDGTEVINTLDVVDITVDKVWTNETGYGVTQRPDELTLTLTSSDPAFAEQTATLTAALWQVTFSNLPRYAKGTTELAVYTIMESSPVNYTKTVGSAQVIMNTSDEAYTATLQNALDLVDIDVTKRWDDQSDLFKIRPATISVTLLRDGTPLTTATLTAATQWTYKFAGLLKTDKTDGHAYTYTIAEKTVPGYKVAAISGTAQNIILTNSLRTVTVSGRKTWSDDNNSHGTRPGTLTVYLMSKTANSDWVRVNAVPAQTVGAPWEWTFANLPETDAAGNLYTYGAYETPDPRYTAQMNAGNPMNLTNTLNTIVLRAQKVWMDEGNEGNRPQVLTLSLASSTGRTYTASVIDRLGEWYAEFTVPKYDANGAAITYTLSENVPTGYRLVSIENWEPIAGAAKESYEAIVTNEFMTTSVTINKIWRGATRTSVTMRLMDGGTVLETISLTRPWTHTFTNLPRYRADGVTPIAYTVVEVVPNNFTARTTRTVNEDGTTVVNIVNTYNPPEEPTPTPTPTETPTETPTPTPIVTPPPFPTTTKTVTDIYNIEDDELPLGAGINLNLGDCFD